MRATVSAHVARRPTCYLPSLTPLTLQGGGSDIGALLGNLGPLIGGLSGVSVGA
jgi:hypothetical protein